MSKKKLQNRAVLWTKKEQEARREEMEELHPGYLDMQLRLHVMLGAVLFARGFFHAFSIMLGQEALSYIILAPISLLVGFFMYRCCMQFWGLSGLFFVFRLAELVKSLWSTLPYVFYLNFIGTVWWVTLVACLLLDLAYLGYLTFSKKGRQQIKYNQIINSSQVISLQRIMSECPAMDAAEAENRQEDAER